MLKDYMTKHGPEPNPKWRHGHVAVFIRHSSPGTISLYIVKLGRGWPGVNSAIN